MLAIDCIGVDETDVTFIGGSGTAITVVGDDIVSEAESSVLRKVRGSIYLSVVVLLVDVA